ncbi:MAG: inorganic pyrophosphatase [Chloroflexi bacterium]|nr:inorganic pyrophosphatase [Chloroflexota bacterium]
MFHKPYYRWRPHPWHGLEVGPKPPSIVNAYIEITPFDLVKYEVDKGTGYLRVDRPQRTSSLPPTLYGLIPRTYCGKRVGELSEKAKLGDGDPLDICVVSEQPITKSEIILTARVVGGIHMIDHGEADDKIIAVLIQDNVWGNVNDIAELPEALVQRLQHYFSTYKLIPGKENEFSIERVYGCKDAYKVVQAAIRDYNEEFEGFIDEEKP